MSNMLRVIKEAALVALITVAFGIVANAYHSKGLDLRRDFFRGLRDTTPAAAVNGGGDESETVPPTDPSEDGPEAGDPAVGAPGGGDPASGDPASGDPAGADPGETDPSPPSTTGSVLDSFEGPSRLTAKRLLDKNIQVITHDEVVDLYEDELFEYGVYAFVDARTPSKFAEGHIPSAVLFDHFHFDQYIDDVFNHCVTAITVIIYCHGGECTDSELAAQLLLDRGVEREKLKVYVGGVEAWVKAGLPLKQGDSQ